MAQNDGGPAFSGQAVTGMSLRDYFAAAALSGLMAKDAVMAKGDLRKLDSPEELSTRAYRLADAMLTVRGDG